MAVYVDDARHALGRMVMGHVLADTLDELHKMAIAIGMKAEWYQPGSFPHYDVSRTRRAHAVMRGAIEVDRRGIVAIKPRLRGCPTFRESVRRRHEADALAIPVWAIDEMPEGKR